MFGLSILGTYIVVMAAVLTAIVAVDAKFNVGKEYFGVLSGCSGLVILMIALIPFGFRNEALDSFKKTMPFKNPLVLTNDTREALLYKVQAETFCVSKTFEAVLQPGEVAYFSSSSGGYCVLNVLKHDGSRLDSKYEKLVREEEMKK